MIRTVPMAAPLPAGFYGRPAAQVAQDLLGAVVVSSVDGEPTAGRIVETEAYVGPHDPASHAAERIGRTARNAAMFGRPGTAYVYRIYGVHWCLNVVTDAEEFPAAVLIRALEPVHGGGRMRRRRGLDAEPGGNGRPPARRASGRDATRLVAGGPGRLTRALGVTGELDGHALDSPPLVIVPGEPVPASAVVSGVRIGVTRAKDWPLRFFVRGHSCVSR